MDNNLAEAFESVRQLKAGIEQLKAERDALLAVVEAVEWTRGIYQGESQCPECKWFKHAGHTPDCQLAAALRLSRGER